MTKKYNLGNKSDMNKLMKDIEKQIKDDAKHQLKLQKYDITCPHCQAPVSVYAGKSNCPFCKEEIDLKLDIHL